MLQKALDRLTVVVLVTCLLAGLLALLVFSGLTDTDALRRLLGSAGCETAPTVTLRDSVAMVVVTSPGAHDLGSATARLRDLGYDVELVAAAPGAGPAGRILSARSRAPQELLDGQGIVVPSGGLEELRLGVDTYLGDWVVEVGCADDAATTP